MRSLFLRAERSVAPGHQHLSVLPAPQAGHETRRISSGVSVAGTFIDSLYSRTRSMWLRRRIAGLPSLVLQQNQPGLAEHRGQATDLTSVFDSQFFKASAL